MRNNLHPVFAECLKPFFPQSHANVRPVLSFAEMQQLLRDWHDDHFHDPITAAMAISFSAMADAICVAMDSTSEPQICNSCAGSGEGMHEDSRCSACKGQGEVAGSAV